MKKYLIWTKLKAFPDDEFKAAKMTISVHDSIESIVGKGENAGNQHFLLLPQCLQKIISLELLKVGIMSLWERGKITPYSERHCRPDSVDQRSE